MLLRTDCIVEGGGYFFIRSHDDWFSQRKMMRLLRLHLFPVFHICLHVLPMPTGGSTVKVVDSVQNAGGVSRKDLVQLTTSMIIPALQQTVSQLTGTLAPRDVLPHHVKHADSAGTTGNAHPALKLRAGCSCSPAASSLQHGVNPLRAALRFQDRLLGIKVGYMLPRYTIGV